MYPLHIILLLLLIYPAHGLAHLVTGASGYIGRAVVCCLLDELQQRRDPSSHSTNIDGDRHGDIIVCLVRPQRVREEQQFWSRYGTTNGVVQVLPYDMLDGGTSLRHALRTSAGNSYQRCLFHTASYYGPSDDHQQRAVDNVQGTVDLVRLLAQEEEKGHPTRLILTSSMAAVRGQGQAPRNGQFYTHEDWNCNSVLGASWGASYQWSKTESERQAWDLCSRSGLDMVALCPSFVLGPSMDMDPSLLSSSATSSSSSYSVDLVRQWVRGDSPVQSRLFVDVRDVAAAHAAAATRPNVVGQRYIVSAEARIPGLILAQWLVEEMMHRPQPPLFNPDQIHCDAAFSGGSVPIGEKEVESVARLRDDLGVVQRSIRTTIADMARGLFVGERGVYRSKDQLQ